METLRRLSGRLMGQKHEEGKSPTAAAAAAAPASGPAEAPARVSVERAPSAGEAASEPVSPLTGRPLSPRAQAIRRVGGVGRSSRAAVAVAAPQRG